ncbi:MAG TPA: SigE family RNA polymerase sigma factor [Streptosporangiaceae bacterium]|nr:SigE family RNA polymerase sigma factor [Streptosporangiaceae bacterium]
MDTLRTDDLDTSALEEWLDPRQAVTNLYQEHAVALIRLAVVMLGDRGTAEDVVQEAFCGLYRRWPYLCDSGKALPYLRSCVLNGCRSVLRSRRYRLWRWGLDAVPASWSADSPETSVLVNEEHRQVLAALQRLPARQREALVLRFFAELPEPQIALVMGISQGTVKSTTSRALVALGRLIRESS